MLASSYSGYFDGRTCARVVKIALGLTAALYLGSTMAHAATITVGNFGNSGDLVASDDPNNDDFTTAPFNNDGEFLVVTLSAAAPNGDLASDLSAPTVTFGTQTMTLVTANQRSTRGYAAVYYLADPSIGSSAVTVDFNANVMPDTTGSIIVGYASLFNVDEVDPIAGTGTITNMETETISAILDPIEAGDLLVTAITADDNVDYPQYKTATGSPSDNSTQLYFSDLPGNNREAQSYFVSLVTGDVNIDGDVVLTRQDARSEAGVGVAFNAIPEPASLALLGLGGLLMIPIRRRG